MTIRTLAQLAAVHIPSVELEYMTPAEKLVLNFEIFPFIKRFGRQAEKAQPLLSMCDCNDCGNCLCYLHHIRHLSLDVYWGSPSDFEAVGGWLTYSK